MIAGDRYLEWPRSDPRYDGMAEQMVLRANP
jgi:hypothetical protein